VTQKEKGCLLSEDSKYNLKHNFIPVCVRSRSWVAFDTVTANPIIKRLWHVNIVNKVF
jgi:hypothetical protein